MVSVNRNNPQMLSMGDTVVIDYARSITDYRPNTLRFRTYCRMNTSARSIRIEWLGLNQIPIIIHIPWMRSRKCFE